MTNPTETYEYIQASNALESLQSLKTSVLNIIDAHARLYDVTLQADRAAYINELIDDLYYKSAKDWQVTVDEGDRQDYADYRADVRATWEAGAL